MNTVNFDYSAGIAPTWGDDDHMTFRPFEDSFLNGIWLYDNEFPRTECANDDERAGYDAAAFEDDWRYEAETNYRNDLLPR